MLCNMVLLIKHTVTDKTEQKSAISREKNLYRPGKIAGSCVRGGLGRI